MVRGKVGHILGHEMFTDRPVDETPQCLSGVEVGRADSRGDVIDSVAVSFA